MKSADASFVALRDDHFYTPEDVAEALGLSTEIILRDVRRSRLRAIRRRDALLIRASDIAIYREQRSVWEAGSAIGPQSP
jgi:hypothetical protein